MIKDKRLEKLAGKRIVIANTTHPSYGAVGNALKIEKTKEGSGLYIELDDGSNFFVFSASEVKLLVDENDTNKTVEEIIENLSACNYSPERIARYLELDVKAFMKQWYNKDSNIRKHYDNGQLEADLAINSKLLENAKTGSITSVQIFLKNQETNRVENLKKQIFYGFEA